MRRAISWWQEATLNRVHLLIQRSVTCTSSTKGDLYEYSAQDNGAIIGATAVVDPSIVGRACPNTIRANDAVRTVSFDTTKLRTFLKENAPNIEAALLILMYVDLIGGLRRDRKIAATLDRVKELLLAKCRKQSVTPAEKRVIQDLCEKRQYHGQAVLHPAQRDNGLVETGVEEWGETPRF